MAGKGREERAERGGGRRLGLTQASIDCCTKLKEVSKRG